MSRHTASRSRCRRHGDQPIGASPPALADPREVLAVATYPLRYRRTACAQVAGSALEDLGPDHAFVTLQERGLDPASAWPDFRTSPNDQPISARRWAGRPTRRRACLALTSATTGSGTAGGRHFHADVAVGTRASAETQAQAWAVLDSLRVDPKTQPDWQSSG